MLKNVKSQKAMLAVLREDKKASYGPEEAELDLFSERKHPKKYEVSKRFFIRNEFISTGFYELSFL